MIHIEYKNEDGVIVDTEDMDLNEYVEMKKLALQRVIGDVERLIYSMNGNKPRALWGEETTRQFSAIRRQLLDCAGDISRMPSQIICVTDNREENIQSFWNRVFGS